MSPVNARAFRKCARILGMRAHVMSATKWPTTWPGGWTASASRGAPYRGILHQLNWFKTPQLVDRHELIPSKCLVEAGGGSSFPSKQPRPGDSGQLIASRSLPQASWTSSTGSERRNEAPGRQLTPSRRLSWSFRGCPLPHGSLGESLRAHRHPRDRSVRQPQPFVCVQEPADGSASLTTPCTVDRPMLPSRARTDTLHDA
jgi:hypothetical protein